MAAVWWTRHAMRCSPDWTPAWPGWAPAMSTSWFAEAWDGNVPLDKTLAALEFAVRTGPGQVRGYFQLQGLAGRKAAATSAVPLVAVQAEYSFLDRTAETELIPAAEDAGLGLMAWGPLGRGVLTGKYRGSIPAVPAAPRPPKRPMWNRIWRRSRRASWTRCAWPPTGWAGVPRTWRCPGCCPSNGVATAIVGARTTVQLKDILDAQLAPLPPRDCTGAGGRFHQPPGLLPRPARHCLASGPVPGRRLFLDDFQVLVVDVASSSSSSFVVDDLKRGHFAIRFVEGVVVDFKGIGDGEERRFDRGIPVSAARRRRRPGVLPGRRSGTEARHADRCS